MQGEVPMDAAAVAEVRGDGGNVLWSRPSGARIPNEVRLDKALSL
jgi:hypothetical protein